MSATNICRLDSAGNVIFGGSNAGGAITIGGSNLIFGAQAGAQLTSASCHVLIGNRSGLYVTTNGGVNTGQPSTYIGYLAGTYTSGGGNVAVGTGALSWLSGDAVGSDTYSETAIGENALASVAATQKDTAVGSYALYSYRRGGQMTAIGRGAFDCLVEGSYSFAAGHGAAGFHVYTTESIYIGDAAGGPSAWGSGAPPRFTASQTGTVLNVTSFSVGDAPLSVGMQIVSTAAAALPSNPVIASFGTGTGGVGTYNVSVSQTVASQTMRAGAWGIRNIVHGKASGTLGYGDSNNIIFGNDIAAASASNVTIIGKGQTASYVSGNPSYTLNVTALSSAAPEIYTALQMRGGLIRRSGAAAVSDVLATAADIVGSIPGVEIGACYDLAIRNNNTDVLTITAPDTSITLQDSTTIASGATGRFKVQVTNIGSPAITVWGL